MIVVFRCIHSVYAHTHLHSIAELDSAHNLSLNYYLIPLYLPTLIKYQFYTNAKETGSTIPNNNGDNVEMALLKRLAPSEVPLESQWQLIPQISSEVIPTPDPSVQVPEPQVWQNTCIIQCPDDWILNHLDCADSV